jgi:HSP20 family protein
VLRADLPGLTKDDVEIEVKDGVLSISGERKSEHHDSGEGFYRIERAFGRFSRSLDLPAGIDAASVAAEFDNGVLEVRIPSRRSASRPRSRSAVAMESSTSSKVTLSCRA